MIVKIVSQKKNEPNNLHITNLSDKGVRSLSGRCSSKASTTQLAMMVSRTAYSNTVFINEGKKIFFTKSTLRKYNRIF